MRRIHHIIFLPREVAFKFRQLSDPIVSHRNLLWASSTLSLVGLLKICIVSISHEHVVLK